MGMGETYVQLCRRHAGRAHPARSAVFQPRRAAHHDLDGRRAVKMRELAHEELPINLAISLHAPNEVLRKQLIPWAEHFRTPSDFDAARYYFEIDRSRDHARIHPASGVTTSPNTRVSLVKVCKTDARQRQPHPL
jgi:adenine C2-methylase RlmN of 23S rRNA A2503 and tRNA A37